MLVAWIATKGMLFFPARVSDPVKAAVEAFGRAQEAATPDKQAAFARLDARDHSARKARHQDLEKCKSNEKESVVARLFTPGDFGVGSLSEVAYAQNVRFYAHTAEDKYGNPLPKAHWQLLKDHLRQVAGLAK